MKLINMVKSVKKIAITRAACLSLGLPALLSFDATDAFASSPAFPATSAKGSGVSSEGHRQLPWMLANEGCGLRRSVLVRFEDGQPASGVAVQLSAAPADLGGPQFYMREQVISENRCAPMITGTLTATTDSEGLAAFDQLGEGVWTLTFSGSASYRGHAVPLADKTAQGLPPFGTGHPEGQAGGFQERLSLLTLEHGGSEEGREEEPAAHDPRSTTSLYVLLPQSSSEAWIPTIDLSDELSNPLPLSTILAMSTSTAVAAHTGESTVQQQQPPGRTSSPVPTRPVPATNKESSLTEHPVAASSQPYRSNRSAGNVVFPVWAVVLFLCLSLFAIVAATPRLHAEVVRRHTNTTRNEAPRIEDQATRRVARQTKRSARR